MNKIYDVVIIGSGVAGATAAIYAKRAGLKFKLIEKLAVGGMITKTSEVENVTGFGKISGIEMGMTFLKHLNELDIKVDYTEVKEVKKIENDIFEITTNNEVINSKFVIMATGATPKKINVKGEEEFFSKGVSYCATCDGMFFKDKDVAIIGAGDSGFMSAKFMGRIAKKVYILQHNNSIKANFELQQEVKNIENVEIILNAKTEEISGENVVNQIKYTDMNNNELKELSVSGVFIAVGMSPNSELVRELVKLDNINAIITDENMQTSLKGLYAIGDVRNTKIRQVITGAADAVYAIEDITNKI